MDFTFSEEQQMLRETIRDWTNKELKPLAAQIDAEHEIPESIKEGLKELGFYGVHLPERFGGAEMGEVGLCIFMEEITRGCFSTAVFAGGHMSIGANAVDGYGSEELKQRYLPAMVEGQKIGCYALTEAESGSDAGAMTTTAVRDGDDWIIDGTKIWITNGDIADVIVLFAMTDKDKGTRGGITAFVVDGDAEGVNPGKPEDKMGQCGSSTVELQFDKVRVPDSNRLGAVGDGFKVALGTLDKGRLTLGANCLGAAKEALALAVEYAEARIAFGKPITAQQAIQHMLADMATDIDEARLLVWEAAWQMDQGKDVTRDATLMKQRVDDIVVQVADRALQVLGGYGYIREYSVELWLRNARGFASFDGLAIV